MLDFIINMNVEDRINIFDQFLVFHTDLYLNNYIAVKTVTIVNQKYYY